MGREIDLPAFLTVKKFDLPAFLTVFFRFSQKQFVVQELCCFGKFAFARETEGGLPILPRQSDAYSAFFHEQLDNRPVVIIFFTREDRTAYTQSNLLLRETHLQVAARRREVQRVCTEGVGSRGIGAVPQ